MAKLQLSLIMGANDRSRPVLDGAVSPDGIDLTCTVAHPSEIFWRQLHFQEFDVSEMSLSSLLMAMAQGNRDWIALPIFTSRRFFHTGAWVRADSGIDKPADLKGKRVGVPEYQQTAALWSRGVLKHEFGVEPQDMEWWMERTEERSHGGATGFKPPEGIRFHRIGANESIGSMLTDGQLDATLLYITDNNLVDRSRITLEGNPRFRLLFPNPAAEGQRYFEKTGIFQINHGMVVRRSLYEQHPWVALNIFNAFRLAKERVAARMRDMVSTHVELGLLGPDARKALSFDPYPYGVKSNQKVLDTVADYSFEQGLTPRRMQLDEIFAPSTLDL
ncbi:MAG TPA: ABC transporter substrate-binding protein [Chloroflexota bacterium]|jgi:4,5-dihydroxyphthalate decarboxylase